MSRRGLKISFIILWLSLAPLYLSAFAVASEHGLELNTLLFILITGLYLLSFSLLALCVVMLFDKQDRFRPWVITRHWAVFYLSLTTALCFGLYLIGLLPFMAANGIAFAAYIGLLAIDIRLIQKVVGMNWGMAILMGCTIIAAGLTLLMLSIQQIST